MSSDGYQELRAFSGEDYTLVLTVEGSGTLGGTYAGHLYGPDGAEIDGAVSVSISDAAARELTAVIAGQSLVATAYYAPYRYEIRQTDAGSRHVVAWGPLELTDPAAAPPT